MLFLWGYSFNLGLEHRKILYQGRSEGGVYPIYPHQASQLFLSPKACNNTSRSSVFNKTLWHMRLGHPMIKLSIAYFLVSALYILIMLRITLVLTVCMVKCTTFLFHILILKLLLPLNLCILSCGVLHLLFLSMVINITFYLLIITLDLVGFIHLSPNLKPLLSEAFTKFVHSIPLANQDL